MKGLTAPQGSIFRWISLLVFSIIVVCCNQTEKCSSELTCAQLDSIETVMFKYPNLIDSLLQQVDTTDITPHERARLQTCRGLSLNEKGEFDQSISKLVEAEDFFVKENDEYHVHINRLIRAFGFEQLKLFNEAAKLFVQCDDFFRQHDHKVLRFYSSLGVLRLHEHFGLLKEEQEQKLKGLTVDLDDEYYNALFLTTLAYVSQNDSLKTEYYGRARRLFKKLKRWDKVFTFDLNQLIVKLRSDQFPRNMEINDLFPLLDYPSELNEYQFYKLRLWRGYAMTKDSLHNEAIVILSEVLQEAKERSILKDEIVCYNILANLYSRIGEYQQAYETERKYINAKYRQEVSLKKSQLIALGANYRFSELERKALYSKLKTKKILTGLIVLIVIILLIVSVSWIIYRENKYKQSLLQQQNIRAEMELQNAIIKRTQEEKKNRELVERLNEAKEEYNALRNKKDGVENECFMLKQKHDKIRNTLNEYTNKLRQEKEKNSELFRELGVAQKEFDDLQSEMLQEEQERDNSVKKNYEIEEQLKIIKEELKVKNVENDNLIKRIEVQKSKITATDELRVICDYMGQDPINSWMAFEERFKELHPNWVNNLRKEYPGFTNTEIRNCMCIYYKLENYTIAKITEVSYSGVKSAKTRLRKKTGVDSFAQLCALLEKFE